MGFVKGAISKKWSPEFILLTNKRIICITAKPPVAKAAISLLNQLAVSLVVYTANTGALDLWEKEASGPQLAG